MWTDISVARPASTGSELGVIPRSEDPVFLSEDIVMSLVRGRISDYVVKY